MLGLRQLGVVAHGRFTRRGFARAIEVAARGVQEDVIGRTRAALEAGRGAALRPVPRRGRRIRCPVRAGGYGVEPMTREQVFSLIRAHLADELELDPDTIQESTRFREDLEADSLDLYTLVQELEDSYGVKISDEEAAKILTVGQAVDFVLASGVGAAAYRRPRAKALTLSDDPRAQDGPGRSGPRRSCGELLERAARRARRRPCSRTASWTARRSDSYERLAFLGDSVLALAITAHLYPRLEAERFGAGRLTKIRAQAVSGRSCRAVAERLGVPERLPRPRPPGAAATCRRWSRPSACWRR